MLVAGPHLPTLVDVTKWFHWQETGLEPGLTAKVRGLGLVTWLPYQTRRRMSWSCPFYLNTDFTGSVELMLCRRGCGSGLTEHPGSTPTGVAANQLIQGVHSTIFSSLVQARSTVSGAIMKSIVECGPFASIKRSLW